MPYFHDTYVVPGGRDLALSYEVMQRGILIPRQLAMIAFRLPPHDEFEVGNGFVIPSTAATERINSERAETDAMPLGPVASVRQDTVKDFVASTVETGLVISQEGFPFAKGLINPEASVQELELIQQIGQSLQQGQYEPPVDTQDDQGLHMGLYL